MQTQISVKRLLPTLIGAAGVALWATETTLITFTTEVPPVQTVALSFLFATLLSPFAWLITGDDPLAAFGQPVSVWVITIGALVTYHACIYYATQQAPPAAAALLQGTTPLIIVIGSALLPGERLRLWHVLGASLGFFGIWMLIGNGAGTPGDWSNSGFYLSLIGIGAALWGFYAILSRSQPGVPSSALGVFYAVAAVICLVAHVLVEDWVWPDAAEWMAIAGLGILPLGLAILFWDFGIKNGDIQALGALAYLEPFIGAVLVAWFAGGSLGLDLLLPGALVVCGAVLASANLWQRETVPATAAAIPAE